MTSRTRPRADHRGDLAALLWIAVQLPAGAARDRALLAVQHDPALAASTAQRLVEEQVTSAHSRGWAPAELLHVIGRRVDPLSVAILAAALVAVHARLPAADRRWAEQIDRVTEAGVAVRTRPATLSDAVGLIAELTGLPTLPTSAPPPTGPAGRGTDDDRARVVLDRVRALLRKAESTEFDAEAEALTAKAQQLITRHAIDEAAIAGMPGQSESDAGPVLQRILLDTPYLPAKALLVGVVARANRCQAAFYPRYGWCTVVGYPSDLAATELLVASLLTQAVGAMARTGPRRDAHGRVRTRSFRRTFLEAFATRIGQRLAATAEAVVAELDEGSSLHPVLASREVAVGQVADRLIGRTTTMRRRPLDLDGWRAGVAAADLASLRTAAGSIPQGGGG